MSVKNVKKIKQINVTLLNWNTKKIRENKQIFNLPTYCCNLVTIFLTVIL